MKRQYKVTVKTKKGYNEISFIFNDLEERESVVESLLTAATEPIVVSIEAVEEAQEEDDDF